MTRPAVLALLLAVVACSCGGGATAPPSTAKPGTDAAVSGSPSVTSTSTGASDEAMTLASVKRCLAGHGAAVTVDSSPTTRGSRGNLEASFPATKYAIAFFGDGSEAASAANELKSEAEAFGLSSADADARIKTAGSVLYYAENENLPTTTSATAFVDCLKP